MFFFFSLNLVRAVVVTDVHPVRVCNSEFINLPGRSITTTWGGCFFCFARFFSQRLYHLLSYIIIIIAL